MGQVAVIILVTCLSSYCTNPDKETKITPLSADETYLVDSYIRISSARDLAVATPLKSDSLFAALDSTIDTTRIANTIRALNGDPDRWIPVYRAIERGLKEAPAPGASGGTGQGEQEAVSEQPGG